MQDTANCDECPLKKLKGNCPNYIENWWIAEEDEKPKLVKDCAPKRTLLMLQDLYNKLFGVQKQQAEVCGQLHKMSEGLRIIAKDYLEQKDVILLEESGIVEGPKLLNQEEKDDIPTVSDSSA